MLCGLNPPIKLLKLYNYTKKKLKCALLFITESKMYHNQEEEVVAILLQNKVDFRL